MSIRCISIALIRDGDEVFVGEGYDSVKQETFYRFLGGGIEFGESAAETIVREFQEELKTDVLVAERLGVYENHFILEGITGHQVVFVFSASFQDVAFYHRQDVIANEEGLPFVAKWVSVKDFISGRKRLYPEAVIADLF